MQRFIKAFTFFSCLLLASSALADELGNWIVGPGFRVGGVITPPMVEQTNDGIQVTHGGFYIGDLNWAGIASKNKHQLDGFSMEIRFDHVPLLAAAQDAWISIGFMEFPQLFQLRNIAGNRGYVNLIRLGSGRLVSHEAINRMFPANTILHDGFNFESGDTLTVSVEKRNDAYWFKFNEIEAGFAFRRFGEIFSDGKAYLVISASMRDSPVDAFTYTILSINGFSLGVR